jgi:hypothetical protein
MVESGVAAVLIESPAGPVGLVPARDVIEAVAVGGDPDVVWAGEIMRSAPRMVSCQQHPANIGEEMAAYDLEIVAEVGEESSVGWPLPSTSWGLSSRLRGHRGHLNPEAERKFAPETSEAGGTRVIWQVSLNP